MILPVDQARSIAAGRVTRVFLPVRKAETVKRRGPRKGIERVGLSATYERQPWIPVVDRVEPIQARVPRKDKPGVSIPTYAHARIVAHNTIPLGDLLDGTATSLKAIRAAGHRTIAGFCDTWMTHYGRGWPPTEERLCPRCDGYGELTDDGAPAPDGVEGDKCPDCEVGMQIVAADLDDEFVVARFRRKHAPTIVHAVILEVDRTDAERWLSPTAKPRGDDLGYTSNSADALVDAGEAVPVVYQDALSKQARARDDELRRKRGEGRDIRRAERNKVRYLRRKAA